MIRSEGIVKMADFFKELFKEPSNVIAIINMTMTVSLGIYVLRSNKKHDEKALKEKELKSFVNEMNYLKFQALGIYGGISYYLGFKEGFNKTINKFHEKSKKVFREVLTEKEKRIFFENFTSVDVLTMFGDISEEEMQYLSDEMNNAEPDIDSIIEIKKEIENELVSFMKNMEKVDWQKFPHDFSYLYYDLYDIIQYELRSSWKKEPNGDDLIKVVEKLNCYVNELEDIYDKKINELENSK